MGGIGGYAYFEEEVVMMRVKLGREEAKNTMLGYTPAPPFCSLTP